MPGNQRRAAAKTIRALKDRLTPGDESVVAMVLGLADAVDADPSNAALWRELRAAVTALSEAGADVDVDDDTEAFLLALRTPMRTKVVDPKNS